jgi:hypothetical protein
MMNINSVKLLVDGWLVNNVLSVPSDVNNRDAVEVFKWIAAGNTPEPEFSESEVAAKVEAIRREGIDAGTKSRIIALFEGATGVNYLEKQLNAMMRAVRLNAMPKSSQTAAQKEEAAALTEIAARVESLRAIGKAAKTDGSNPSDINWTQG